MTEPVPGTLAEELARLVEALGDWARGAIGDVGVAGVGDGAECQVCPFCRLIAVLRRTQPDTVGHLTDASASLLAALRTIIDRHDHSGRANRGVERIDLDPHDTFVHEESRPMDGRP